MILLKFLYKEIRKKKVKEEDSENKGRSRWDGWRTGHKEKIPAGIPHDKTFFLTIF